MYYVCNLPDAGCWLKLKESTILNIGEAYYVLDMSADYYILCRFWPHSRFKLFKGARAQKIGLKSTNLNRNDLPLLQD